MDAQALEAARAVAFHFLGYAPRSRAEIARRLERDDFAPEIIAAIVAEMEAQGWVDDTAFAQRWVEDRADRKKYGRGRLAAELRQRGVEKETLTEALDAVTDAEELKRALAAARTRWRPDVFAMADDATRQAEKRKLMGFLQRRGFAWDIIRQVFAELMANQE